MPRKPNLDKQIEAEYYRQGYGIQINMFSIPKIFEEAKTAIAQGESLPDAIASLISKYRLN